jgi:hypothetical protein
MLAGFAARLAMRAFTAGGGIEGGGGGRVGFELAEKFFG